MENQNETPLQKVEDEVERELDEVIELEQKEVKVFSTDWYLISAAALLIIGFIVYIFFF